MPYIPTSSDVPNKDTISRSTLVPSPPIKAIRENVKLERNIPLFSFTDLINRIAVSLFAIKMLIEKVITLEIRETITMNMRPKPR